MNDEIEVNVWAFDLLSFAACSIILSFSLLAVSLKYVSKHVFSGHSTKYV